MSTGRGQRGAAARAISLIETAISAAILAGLMAAVLSAAGASASRRAGAVEAQTAQQLADELAAEIATLAFDPIANATGLTARAAMNDLADAHGWSESPPASPAGAPLSHLTGWTRSIAVEWVLPGNPGGSAVGGDTGCRRITVTVSRGAPGALRALATAQRLVTRAGREALP